MKTISTNSLIGLVLAAGESKRMKTDKAFITYHQIPQYLHAANMLNEICFRTIINGKSFDYNNQFEVIVDDKRFRNVGPIGGVLTANQLFPDASIFVLGVDYPFLKQETLLNLYQSFVSSQRSVCFKHPVSQLIEPLIAIYHQSDLNGLRDFFDSGQTSLRHFLSQMNPLILETASASELTSVDEPL